MKSTVFKLFTTCILTTLYIFTGCEKDDNGANSSTWHKYTAGFYSDGSKYIPCYWVDKYKVDLPINGTDGYAFSIKVSDDKVYTAGYYYDESKSIPCYWLGTNRYDLPGDGTHQAYAYSIALSGNMVYTAGYYMEGSKYVPCFWNGTTRNDLQGDGIHNAYAPGIQWWWY